MSSPDHPSLEATEAVQRTLEQLGVRDGPALQERFALLEALLHQDTAPLQAGATEDAVEALRVRWLGRKQGIIRGITDNWLRSAPPELKRETGQRLNALRKLAEHRIEQL